MILPTMFGAHTSKNGAVSELSASVKKSKAFDWLLHNIEFVDSNGRN